MLNFTEREVGAELIVLSGIRVKEKKFAAWFDVKVRPPA